MRESVFILSFAGTGCTNTGGVGVLLHTSLPLQRASGMVNTISFTPHPYICLT